MLMGCAAPAEAMPGSVSFILFSLLLLGTWVRCPGSPACSLQSSKLPCLKERKDLHPGVRKPAGPSPTPPTPGARVYIPQIQDNTP